MVTVPENTDETTRARIHSQLSDHLGGREVILIADSMTIKALPTNGVYHRERLDDYEIEIIAETEEALQSRLHPNKS